MTRLTVGIALAMVLTLVASEATFAASAADCKAMYEKIDTANAGHIDDEEAKPYINAMLKAGLKPADNSELTDEEFIGACMRDVFKDVVKRG